MTEDQKKNLETQLWSIANLLRGKISADDRFYIPDYILGFIFFKYLSVKPFLYIKKEKQKIADCLSLMGQSINELRKQMEQTILFKKGLLQGCLFKKWII